MRPFRFPLAAVLDDRRAAEAGKLRLLGEAERALTLERSKLAALEVQRRQRGALLRDVSAEAARTEVRRVLIELDIVGAAIARQGAAVEAAAHASQSAREEYLAARSAREQLATLRDRRHALFVAEANRREAAEDDEANGRTRTILP